MINGILQGDEIIVVLPQVAFTDTIAFAVGMENS